MRAARCSAQCVKDFNATVGKTLGGTRYSRLGQITPANASNLEQVINVVKGLL